MSNPKDEEVDRVREWKFAEPGSFDAFMDYVKSIGKYWPKESFGWTQDGRIYHVSTGGWSGNEEILGAMQANWVFWVACWQEHRRGGHYIFELPDPAVYWRIEGGETMSDMTTRPIGCRCIAMDDPDWHSKDCWMRQLAAVTAERDEARNTAEHAAFDRDHYHLVRQHDNRSTPTLRQLCLAVAQRFSAYLLQP